MNAVTNSTGTSKALNPRGIPQGLSISGALAALYMQLFDEQQQFLPYPYYRYVDDILFICPASKADELLKTVSRKLLARGLKVHPRGKAGKTEISPVLGGIDFLGYRVCPQKVSIRESSYKKMFVNIQSVLTDFRYRRDLKRTVFKLNLKISGCIVDGRRRGWMMFSPIPSADLSYISWMYMFKNNLLVSVFPVLSVLLLRDL